MKIYPDEDLKASCGCSVYRTVWAIVIHIITEQRLLCKSHISVCPKCYHKKYKSKALQAHRIKV